MSSPLPRPTLGERIALRSLWLVGRLGLGAPLTRLYLWMLAKAGPLAMPSVFRGYAPTDRDVFVCTYSKSGTNWMLQMAVQLIHGAAVDFTHIHQLVPWPEAPVPSQVRPLNAPFDGRRVIKTHVPAAHVPLVDDARYIVVIRDPKEVFVSSFHFVGGIIEGIWGAPPGLEDWLARFLERRFPLGDWAAHTAGWWALRDRPNVLVLRFAELKADLPGSVDRVADFLAISLDAPQRAQVIERATFAWMKAHASKFATPIPSLDGPGAEMIRSGKAGASASLLTPAQQAAIDTCAREGLEALDSDLPYGAFFETPAPSS